MLNIDAAKEKQVITSFLKNKFKELGFKKVVIGLSGGIDSMTSFYLLKETLALKNIIVGHLYYFKPHPGLEQILNHFKMPKENIIFLSIKKPVDKLAQAIGLVDSKRERVRFGNLIARVRMIILYDLAKKHEALVCGTENRSEHLLGYFTRYGDEASDIEAIRHLYKTEVYKLASYLGVPKSIIDQAPSAGLWQGQTDEGEFGFSYKQADEVLYLHFEKNASVKELTKKGYKNAKAIIDFCHKNSFKHHVPYTIRTRAV